MSNDLTMKNDFINKNKFTILLLSAIVVAAVLSLLFQYRHHERCTRFDGKQHHYIINARFLRRTAGRLDRHGGDAA